MDGGDGRWEPICCISSIQLPIQPSGPPRILSQLEKALDVIDQERIQKDVAKEDIIEVQGSVAETLPTPCFGQAG